MPKYIDVAKQLVRLYRLNLDCGDVIREFLVTAEPENVVDKERYDRLLENSTIIADALSKYQSADMVEVVRCKDCIHGIPTRIDTVTWEFSDERYCNRHRMCHFEDYYCADGKRKEGGAE